MCGMRVWACLLSVSSGRSLRMSLEEENGVLIVRVRLQRRDRHRCGMRCRRCPGYDPGDRRRRWRAPELGGSRRTLTPRRRGSAAAARRRRGGSAVCAPRSGHPRVFDDTVAWLAAHTSKSAVGALMRVARRTVGAIIRRVVADGRAQRDPLAGLVRIGIDETSYRTGQRYLVVVLDHPSGRLMWVADGRAERALGVALGA